MTIHLIHGHQVVPWGDPAALLGLSRSLDADLLIHGHTHTTQVWYDKNTQRMMLNPGSTTGAYSPFNTSAPRSQTRALIPPAVHTDRLSQRLPLLTNSVCAVGALAVMWYRAFWC